MRAVSLECSIGQLTVIRKGLRISKVKPGGFPPPTGVWLYGIPPPFHVYWPAVIAEGDL
jgi:hypothetical protein